MWFYAVPASLITAVLAVPAVPIPAFLAIPAVPVVLVLKSTAVLCGSHAVPIPIWNRIEPHGGFMQLYVVFAVPAVL